SRVTTATARRRSLRAAWGCGLVSPACGCGLVSAACGCDLEMGSADTLSNRLMKITAIETFPVYNGARNNLFVTVDTDEGISGVGESGLSNRELAVIGAVEHFKPLL